MTRIYEISGGNPLFAIELALAADDESAAILLAAGRSNKEIAAELFIAEKTVEMYLSAVYRKLGVRSRAALSAALDP